MYKTLNDAADNEGVTCSRRYAAPIEGEGSIEIWYAKDPSFTDDGVFVPNGSHIKVGEVAYQNWRILYGPMQGDNWSPKGEARSLIAGLGLHHTSMSTGDIFAINHPDGRREVQQLTDTGHRLIAD